MPTQSAPQEPFPILALLFARSADMYAHIGRTQRLEEGVNVLRSKEIRPRHSLARDRSNDSGPLLVGLVELASIPESKTSDDYVSSVHAELLRVSRWLHRFDPQMAADMHRLRSITDPHHLHQQIGLTLQRCAAVSAYRAFRQFYELAVKAKQTVTNDVAVRIREGSSPMVFVRTGAWDGREHEVARTAQHVLSYYNRFSEDLAPLKSPALSLTPSVKEIREGLRMAANKAGNRAVGLGASPARVPYVYRAGVVGWALEGVSGLLTRWLATGADPHRLRAEVHAGTWSATVDRPAAGLRSVTHRASQGQDLKPITREKR